ncbi:MAG: AAA family ATPase [Bdellovibrionales bacterium]|nr:AAA family ATPase [Bdellovibrionales bacterium]
MKLLFILICIHASAVLASPPKEPTPPNSRQVPGQEFDSKAAFEGSDEGYIKNPIRRQRSQSMKAPSFAHPFDPQHASTPIFTDIDPTVREKILRSLMKPEIGSVAVLAENGVGKSTIVNAIAYDIIFDNVPDKLKYHDVFFIDIGALSKGSERPGVLEAKVQEIIDLSREEKIIWVVDEVHSLRGQGTHEGNSSDVFQWLKPWMTAGVIKVIGMSTPDEFNGAFSGDPALEDRFSRVLITPPKGEALIKNITNWVKARYGQMLDRQIVVTAIKYAEQFNAIGHQPRKTTLLLQEAFSLLDFRDSKEAMSILTLMEAAMSEWNISEAYFDPDARANLIAELPEKLEQRIVGQPQAKKAIVDETSFAYSGVNNPKTPRVKITLPGPRGTGKTEIVFAYGEAMELPVHRIMMSQYATPRGGDIDKLKNEIYSAVNKNAFVVLFFDELEKCPIEVQDALLDILDHGRFTVKRNTDTTGRNQRTITVDVSKTSVFFATNAGEAEIMNADIVRPRGIGFAAETKSLEISSSQMREILISHNVSGPLIDRTLVVPFHPLSRQHFREVMALQLERTISEIQKNTGAEFIYSTQMVQNMANYLTDRNYQPNMSVRRLQEIFNEELRLPISQNLIEFHEVGKYELTWEYFGNAGAHLIVTPQSVDCEKLLIKEERRRQPRRVK